MSNDRKRHLFNTILWGMTLHFMGLAYYTKSEILTLMSLTVCAGAFYIAVTKFPKKEPTTKKKELEVMYALMTGDSVEFFNTREERTAYMQRLGRTRREQDTPPKKRDTASRPKEGYQENVRLVKSLLTGNDGLTAKELGKSIKSSARTLYRHLTRMIDDGVVYRLHWKNGEYKYYRKSGTDRRTRTR